MRKLILVFAAFVIATSAYSQIDSVNRKASPSDINNTNDGLNQNRDLNKNQNENSDGYNQNRDLNQNQNQNKDYNQSRDLNKDLDQNMQNNLVDGVIMQNGKLMKVENGQVSTCNEEMTLSNGTKVMKDGTYIKKDGTSVTLKEGQHMDMSGNLVLSTTKKDKNMYLVPDSTEKKIY